MVKHILRVDISEGARDFESAALEPGVPLLDRNNTNDNALRKSLGRLAAQPERKTVQGESKQELVEFYVCDDQGGRLHDVECEPVTDSDLRKATSLKQDMEKLKKRLEQVEPAQLRNVLKGQLEALEQQGPAHRQCHFFRYREGKTWNLVWCWGYQRKDLEPAQPRICTNPGCLALYVRRSQGSRTCPVCEGQAVATPKTVEKKSRTGLFAALVLLLLLLAGGVGIYLMKDDIWPPSDPREVVQETTKIVAVPDNWNGPAGGMIEFALMQRKMKGDELVSEKDVSEGVVAISEHPNIAKFESGSLKALARSQGQTVVHFYSGGEEYHATITIQPPKNPGKIYLEPADVTLGIGATAQLKLIGEYADGNKVDLTKAAQTNWLPASGSTIYSGKGWLEGRSEGKDKVRVKYRSSASEPYLEAEANVEVEDLRYESIKLALERTKLFPGDTIVPSVSLVTKDGEEHSATRSSKVQLDVDSREIADFNDEGELAALAVGKIKLTASWNDLEESVEVEIIENPTPTPFEVKPASLALIVGEIGELEVSTPTTDPVKMDSKNPDVAEIVDGRVVGRKAGKTVISVAQSGRNQDVAVEVSEAAIESIAIVPDSVVLRVNVAEEIRVVATTEDGKQANMAGDLLTTEQLPTPTYIEFDPNALTLQGLLPTDGAPQTLALRLGDHKASAQIEVVRPPTSFVRLDPSGDFELPQGQSLQLQVTVHYDGSHDVELPIENIQWELSDEVEGIEFDPETGVVLALEEGVGPFTIQATYQDESSEALRVTTVPPDEDVQVVLEADPSQVFVETKGRLKLLLGDGTDQLDLADQAEFSSDDPEVLAVDQQTGGFIGLKPGEVTVSAAHPALGDEPLTMKLEVEPVPAPTKPESLQLVSDQGGNAATIPVGAKFSQFKVVASLPSGETRDVTNEARLVQEPNPNNAPISISNGEIEGLEPGEAVVQAEFDGARTTDGLKITVDNDVKITAVKIDPESFSLKVDHSGSLTAYGFTGVDGDQPVGEITGISRLTWESDSPDVLDVRGPEVTGVSAGETTVRASIDSARASAEATVEPYDPGFKGSQIVLNPNALRLEVNESRSIGSDITVHIDGVDYTPQSVVSSTNPDIVRVDADRSIVTGVSPGQADLVVTYGDGNGTIPVLVELPNPTLLDEKGTVVVEPSTASIAVAEAQSLRVLFVGESGRSVDRTASAVISSSEPSVLSVDGNQAVGLAEGSAVVTAELPGVDGQGTAQFRVVDVPFERLVISPSRFQISVGDEVGFRVFADGPAGRRELSDHPNLGVEAAGDNPTAIEILGVSRLRGAAEGNASLRVTWKGSIAAEAPVQVTNDAWTDLRIEPTDATVERGGQRSFRVFARRGGRERALTVYDGVDVVVGDTSIARFEGGLAVSGVSLGTTNVTAQFGGMRAAARLTVVEPATPIPSVRRGLRFIPDVLTLQEGTPGASVRLVYVLAGGGQEDVDHQANLDITDDSIVEVNWTASGPVFVPKAVGQTTVTAEYDGHVAADPLLVRVVPDVPPSARLVVRPDPLRLGVGRTDTFNRVMIVSGRGRAPIDVRYRIEAAPDDIVEVVNDRNLHGRAPGTTQVTVFPVDVGPGFANLTATAGVIVNQSGQPGGSGPIPTGSRLVLHGPSRTIVGADSNYRVELVSPSGTVDVTNDATTLVLGQNQNSLCDVLPGCVLHARQPGVVDVKAQHRGLISNPVRLRIGQLPTLSSIELDINGYPMGVNEARPYTVWGYPSNGGPRQDVTNAASIALDPPKGIASLSGQGPQVVGVAKGDFAMRASLGQLSSETENLTVVAGLPPDYILIADPPEMTIRVGELTQPIEVLAQTPTGQRIPINASVAIADSSGVLEDLNDDSGQFRGGKVGTSAIRVFTSDNVETTVRVNVVGTPFRSVELEEDVDLVGNNQFAVSISVVGDAPATTRSYRAVPVGSDKDVPWKPASASGDQVSVRLKSPLLQRGPKGETYRLIIEAREDDTGMIDRYPFDFELIITTKGENR